MKPLPKTLLFIAIAIAVILIAALSSRGKAAAEKPKTANLVYANWEEGIAYTNLAKVVLQDSMGYKVTLTASDVAPGYASVAAGDQDAFMETWLPVLHKDYIEKYGDSLLDLGHIYEGTLSGLAVPTYMYKAGIQTLSDLKKPEALEKLQGTITGIDAGAGLMKTTEEKMMPAYGLDKAGYKLLASSGPAMMAALKEAIKNKKWIVVTAWKPHSMFGYFDLNFLEQDKEKIWQKGDIHITARKDLRKDKPELAQFLSNIKLNDSDLGSLMVAIRETKGPEEAATRTWLAEHPKAVAGWIPAPTK